MKLFISLVVIAVIAMLMYFYSSKKYKRKKSKKIKWNPIAYSFSIALALLILLTGFMYKDATELDSQCSAKHKTNSKPPPSLLTAQDYFDHGNYEYDVGNCEQALGDYSVAIQLDPKFSQAYNNRAYTYMRMRDFQDALPDLDKAIEINPNYMQALMNRGDIYNYYFALDRKQAITDYQKVISLGGTKSTSVCGHLFLAKHNGWNLGTILDFPKVILNTCN